MGAGGQCNAPGKCPWAGGCTQGGASPWDAKVGTAQRSAAHPSSVLPWGQGGVPLGQEADPWARPLPTWVQETWSRFLVSWGPLQRGRGRPQAHGLKRRGRRGWPGTPCHSAGDTRLLLRGCPCRHHTGPAGGAPCGEGLWTALSGSRGGCVRRAGLRLWPPPAVSLWSTQSPGVCVSGGGVAGAAALCGW